MICPVCDGHYSTRSDCPECDGKGTIDMDNPAEQ